MSMRNVKMKETRELLGELLSEVRFPLELPGGKGSEMIDIEDETMRYLIAHAGKLVGQEIDGVKIQEPRRARYRQDIEDYVKGLGYSKNAPVAASIMTSFDYQPQLYALFSEENFTNDSPPVLKKSLEVKETLGLKIGKATALGRVAIECNVKDGGDVGKGEVLFAMLTGLKRQGESKTDVGEFSLKYFGEEGKEAAKLGTSYGNVMEVVVPSLKKIFQSVEDKFSEKFRTPLQIDATQYLPNTSELVFSAGVRGEIEGGYRLKDKMRAFFEKLQADSGLKLKDVYSDADVDNLCKAAYGALNEVPKTVIGSTKTIGLSAKGSDLVFSEYAPEILKFDSVTEGRLKVVPVASLKYENAVRQAYVEASAATDMESIVDKVKGNPTILGSMKAKELKPLMRHLNIKLKSGSDNVPDMRDAIKTSLGITTESRVRGSARKKKSEVSTLVGGSIRGVQVPMGRSPDGKPDKRKGNAILRRNAKMAGKFWGGAKPVNESNGSQVMGGLSWFESGGGVDADGDGDVRGYETKLDTGSVYRGGNGDMALHAKTTGRAFAGAAPVGDVKVRTAENLKETRDLLWELLGFEEE